MLDMAQHYNQGPIQLGDIAKRQDISVKYLEQLIIPLKKANYVTSVRGPRVAIFWPSRPEEITVGEIVALLEEGGSLANAREAGICRRSD